MKRIFLVIGALFIILIGLNSCAVEGPAYPRYYQPRARVIVQTPAPRYYYGYPRYQRYHYYNRYHRGYRW